MYLPAAILTATGVAFTVLNYHVQIFFDKIIVTFYFNLIQGVTIAK
jgi:hypothetical protein